MYKGIKRVREMNGQAFIDDFFRARVILTRTDQTLSYFEVRKKEVWETAKQGNIYYTMDICPFVVPRTCMTIL